MLFIKTIASKTKIMSIKRYLNTWSELNVLKWTKKSPYFPLNSQQIEVIQSPKDFYNTLKSLTLNSKQRITISSLYIGTGTLEQQLIDCLKTVQEKEENMDLTILLDYNRSTRFDDTNGIQSSTKAILEPLTQNGAKIAFYLTPLMSGWRKYTIFNRQKWNELVSLHHIKCYIFDNNLIISGANLSDLYFTCRQDRYILFKDCQPLCDYFDELIKTISTFSMQLNPNGTFTLHKSWTCDPNKYFHRNQFIKEANNRIDKLNDRYLNKYHLIDCNTVVFPLLQLKTLGITDDQYFTSKLLENCSPDADIRLASGYFNLTKEYKQIILNRKSKIPFNLLMASECANGFYGGKGVTAYIPLVYTYLTKTFLKQVESNQSNVALYAYYRPKWTFHAKGLWLSLDSKYFLTMIGSPNFGYRSVYRDSEAQLVLLTTDEELKNKLITECNDLWKFSNLINSDNYTIHVPFWVTLIAKYMRSYF